MNESQTATQTAGRSHERKILLTTFGSLGDLYPYIALARGLQSRGHSVVLASTDRYRERVESAGLKFHPLRPAGPDLEQERELMCRVMDARRGSEYVIRELMMSVLADTYADTLAAAEGADLLVSHVLTFATRLVAEKKQIPWVSPFLQPLGFFSAYDPPALPLAPFLAKLRFFGPGFHRLLFRLADRKCRPWGAPWQRLRAEIGLPPTSENPVMDGNFSPHLVLGLFSELIAARQPDWPRATVIAGFPRPDLGGSTTLPAELERFLDAGPAPIVFTLGSSGLMSAGTFFQESALAAAQLGRRAVLVVGAQPENRPTSMSADCLCVEYAPFAGLFPRAAAVVHAGGIGTTALVMRSGRPSLVMPLAHDQFDNAARAERLGVSLTISQRRYTARRAADRLRLLLDNPQYAQRAAVVQQAVLPEDGVKSACLAMEQLLS
ncbi:MAG: glycosyltransferase family 1 protein [Planctomycetes bacterium]|nr:glycosyltransferase family 1 protein [Planctomycetota bacterium]